MRQWYYLQNAQQTGPIAEDQLVRMLNAGQLDRESLVWTQGMQNWTKAVEVSELGIARGGVPPALPVAGGAIAATDDEQAQKREARIKRIKTFSHVVDWTIFLVLIFIFDVNFVIALVVSIGTGWLIRAAFCR